MAHIDSTVQINVSFSDEYIAKKREEMRKAKLHLELMVLNDEDGWRVKSALRTAKSAVRSYYSLFSGIEHHECRVQHRFGDDYVPPLKYRK